MSSVTLALAPEASRRLKRPRPRGRTCVSQCPRGFWGDRRRCKKCYSSCQSCTGSRSDQCTSCQEGHHLVEDGSTCTAVCGDGYYLDGGESQPAASTLRRRAVWV